jgi:hypothetical protein
MFASAAFAADKKKDKPTGETCRGLRERFEGKGTVGKVALWHVQETLRDATLNRLFSR